MTVDNGKGTTQKAEPTAHRLAYRVKEAADVIGLGRSTLYDLMAKGTLRFVKIGNTRLIPADALRALIEPQAVAV